MPVCLPVPLACISGPARTYREHTGKSAKIRSLFSNAARLSVNTRQRRGNIGHIIANSEGLTGHPLPFDYCLQKGMIIFAFSMKGNCTPKKSACAAENTSL